MSQKIVFLWGSEKGKEVKHCENLPFMKFYLKKLPKKHWQKQIIQNRIAHFENLAR